MLQVKKLLDKFKMEVSNPKTADLTKQINSPAIHRMGLELGGYAIVSKKNHNVIGWGTKESKFLKSLSAQKRIEAIRSVLNKKTPLVLLSTGVKTDMASAIQKVCDEFNITLCKTNLHLSTINATIGPFIVKALAESVNIHGSLVVVNGMGVMIIGKSGIGKSEAVLELIQKGSSFVSDDTVVLKRVGTDFIGESAELTKDFLEARGIGFIDIPKIYGLKATKENVNVDLVIELVSAEELNNVDRLGDMGLKFDVLGGSIDKIQIPVENGRTLSALIEAAVNVYIARIHGHNPMDVILGRNK